jgi:hypothetical protein
MVYYYFVRSNEASHNKREKIVENLIEITSPRQAKNGTRQFYCPRNRCCYASYASGYVRRIYKAWYGENMYPLGKLNFSEVERLAMISHYAKIYNIK